MTDDKRIPVVEIFGPTIQGEGLDIGVPCHFIRFGGCDYKCGFNPATNEFRTDGWVCDSLHAVLPEEVRKAERLTADEIVERLRALGSNVGWIVMSGGNPLLHELGDLVLKLHRAGYKVAVETQGSLWKDWLKTVDLVTISPKPPSTFQNFSLKHLWSFIDKLSDSDSVDPRPVNTAVKIVIWDETDLQFADEINRSIRQSVILSVCNDWQKPDTIEALLLRTRWIHETIVARYAGLQRCRLLPQLHVLLWGNELGH